MTRRELFGHLLKLPLVGGLAMLAAKGLGKQTDPGTTATDSVTFVKPKYESKVRYWLKNPAGEWEGPYDAAYDPGTGGWTCRYGFDSTHIRWSYGDEKTGVRECSGVELLVGKWREVQQK